MVNNLTINLSDNGIYCQISPKEKYRVGECRIGLEYAVEHTASTAHKQLAIDLGKVNILTGTDVRELLKTYVAASHQKVDMSLINVRQMAHTFLKSMKLENVLKIYKTEAEYRAKLYRN